jgi:GT2 family glycosyltransferase
MTARASVPPDITVVIPTYDRREVLRACLEALDHQTLEPERYEVIVGDDGSSDGTGALVDEMRGRSRYALHYFHQANNGPGAARNRALRMARAPIALILNDDTIAIPSLLAEHLRVHAEHPAEEVCVLGRVTISPDVPASIFARLHLDAAFAAFTGRTELDWTAFITANISVKPAFVLRHGPFREGLFPHEDLELATRLRERGLRILYNERALGYHLHHLTERDYLRNAESDGRALARWYRIAGRETPELYALGLQGAPPLRRELRHHAADLVIRPRTFPLLLALARGLARLHETSALFVYRKLFKYVSRRAIERELARA